MAELIGIIVITYILIFGITFLCWRLIKKYASPAWQDPLLIASGTILCAPSFAPATIVAVPMPYGLILIISVFFGAMNESFGIAIHFWKWHLISFFITASLILLGLRLVGKWRKSNAL